MQSTHTSREKLLYKMLNWFKSLSLCLMFIQFLGKKITMESLS